MKLVTAVAVLLCLGVACAERTFPLRSLAARAAADENQRYWYLGAPRKGSNTFQAVQVPLSSADFVDDEEDEDGNNYGQQGVFSIVQDDEDDENSYNDDNNEDSFESNDDDYDSELSGNVIGIIPLTGGSAMFSKRRDNSGLIKLEERDVDDDDDDEETGETTIFVPREALEGIPNGSVVTFLDDSESTGRASSYYRRRRKTPNRRRRGNGGRRRRRGNKRRRRPTIRVIRGGKPVRRVGNRRRRPTVIRG